LREESSSGRRWIIDRLRFEGDFCDIFDETGLIIRRKAGYGKKYSGVEK
jgi:hypothetical protein